MSNMTIYRTEPTLKKSRNVQFYAPKIEGRGGGAYCFFPVSLSAILKLSETCNLLSNIF